MSTASSPSLNELKEAIALSPTTGPLILNGAMGTELQTRGVLTPTPLWSAAALESDPDVVLQIHQEHVAAGAQILVANTFRTNPRALARAYRVADGPRLNRLAMTLARQAANDARKVWIAASVAPAEDCYRPDLAPPPEVLRREHGEMMRWLSDAGATLVWIETIGTIREGTAAGRAAREAGMEFAIAFITREDGRLLSGEPLEDAVHEISGLTPLAVGINCIPPRAIHESLARLAASSPLPRMAYAHIGNRTPLPGWSYGEHVEPDSYAELAESWARDGAAIIGGCCGTTPAHTRALARRLRPV